VVGVGVSEIPCFVGDVGYGVGVFGPEFGEEIHHVGGGAYFVKAEGCVVIHAGWLA